MANILRVKLRWDGISGAPGYSVFHFRDFDTVEGGGGALGQDQAVAAAARVRTFAAALGPLLPGSARLQVESEVELLEETNGQMQNVFGIAAPAVVTGSGTSYYSGPVGAVVHWRTEGVRNGRRIRGRTFLVPLATAAYDGSGGIQATTRTTLQTAADALIDPTGSPDLGVWARPTASGASDGNWFVARSASIPSKAAVLRSRRD